jgi:hypothetical protein
VKNAVVISCPDGATFNSEFTYNGERITCVAEATIRLRPNDVARAELEVYTSLQDLKAFATMLPIWEQVGTVHPERGRLFLARQNGLVFTAMRDADGIHSYPFDREGDGIDPDQFMYLDWV